VPQLPPRSTLLALPLAVLGALASGPAPARAVASPPADRTELSERIDALVEPYVNLDVMSGVILVARGDTVLFAKGYGRADPASNLPNTPDTRFPIGSVTHAFITLAVIQLDQQKLLSIRDPLSKFLPDYPEGDRITLFDLLNYRGGIPPLESGARAPANLDSLIARLRAEPLLFRPGTGVRFSDTGFLLLAKVVEVASGTPYTEYLEKHVFEPAGMTDTGDENAGGKVPDQAVGLMPDPEGPGTIPAPPVDFARHAGSSSLYSTAMDLHRFDRALARGTLTKGRAQLALVQHRLGRRMILHGGSLPGYSADVNRYLEDDVLVVVLMNDGAQVQQILADGVAAVVFGLPTPPFPAFSPDAYDPDLARRTAGRYRLPDRFGFDLRIVGDHLTLDGDDGKSSRLIPEARDTWFSPLFWYHITALPGADGRVDTLLWVGATEPDTLRAARVTD
jgi:CubicO group peptidase (beta-lactamase class C family)